MSSEFDGFADDGITPPSPSGNTPVRSQDEINSDPGGASTTIRRYTGLRADIDALAANLFVIGAYPYQITQAGDSPLAVLTITYSGGTGTSATPFSVEHVFRTGLSQVSLSDHPRFAPVIKLLDRDQKDELQKFLNGSLTLIDSASTNPEIQVLYEMIAEGITTYQRPDPTYTYNARFTAGSTFRPSFATVATVYTKAQLVYALGIPGDFANGLPVGEYMANEIEYERASDGSRSLMQSFWFTDLWDLRIYKHSTLVVPPAIP